MNGKWQGEIITSRGNFPVSLDFNKSGLQYVGTIEIMGKTYALESIDSAMLPKLSLSTHAYDFNGRRVRYDFEGSLTDNILTGKLSAKNMGEMQIKVLK